jgi:hypothetical protein
LVFCVIDKNIALNCHKSDHFGTPVFYHVIILPI